MDDLTKSNEENKSKRGKAAQAIKKGQNLNKNLNQQQSHNQPEKQSVQDKARQAMQRAQNARQNIQRAKQAAQTAKMGAQAARAGAQLAIQAASAAVDLLAATVEIWGPILLVAIVILLAMSIFTILIGAPPEGEGLQNSCPGTCASSCAPPSVEDATYNPTCTSGGVCCVTPAQITCPDIGGTCVIKPNCVAPNHIDMSVACPQLPIPSPPAPPPPPVVCCVPPSGPYNFKFYCQYDHSHDSSACDISAYGCSPTSIAMVAASWGLPWNPLTLAEANGYIGCSTGTTYNQSMSAIANTFPKPPFSVIYGLVSPSTHQLNVSLVQDLTSKGYLVVAGACITFKGNEPYGGHSFVIQSVNPNGTLKVYDPTYCTSDTNYWIRAVNPTVNGPDIKSYGFCGNDGWGWYYAVAIKKLQP